MYRKARDYLRPIQRIATLCGAFPDETLFGAAACRLYNVYSLSLLSVSARSIALAVLYHFTIYKDIVCFTVLMTDTVTFIVHAASTLMPMLLNVTYRKLFKRLDQVERLIHSLNIAQQQCPTDLQLYTWVLFALSALSFFWYAMTFVYRLPALITFGFVANYSSSLFLTLHIVSLISVIKTKYVLINWHLEYLNNKRPIYLAPDEGNAFVENKLRGKHVRQKFVDFALNKREVTADKIRSFNQAHFLLYSCCNLIDKYFSVQMFLYVIVTALTGIRTCLEVFDFYHQDFPGKTIFFITMLYNSALLYYMTSICESIKFESKRTAILVCDLLEEEHTEDVFKELYAFSKELFTRKIVFSACGFFEVDLKIITSMVGLCLPVTLFLIQYRRKQEIRPRLD